MRKAKRKTETLKPIWVADSETDPFEYDVIPEPFIWGIHDGANYTEFTGTGPAFACTPQDIDAMVDWLAEQDVILYAHNGGKFDWHFLSHRFEAGSEMLIINGRLARFKIGKCEFRDSFSLMPVSLDQYNKMKFDYTKMEKEHRANHMPEIREYLKSDCVNLWNMVSGFVTDYGLHITQASAAMHFWQHTLKNKVPRSGPWLYNTFAPYYYGGRVQCFRQGDFKTPAKSADINSAYPYAMLFEHPYSLDYSEYEGKPKCAMQKWGPMFFDVEAVAHGCFPYRSTKGSLYYPDDAISRRYTVTGWEIIAAIETDTVENLKFNSHTVFAKTKNFSEYVMYFWNLRQEFREAGDLGGVFYCKIFMNALYGKFATDPRKYRTYTLRHGSQLKEILASLGDNDSLQHFREWLIVGEEQSGTGKGRFYNLATAASITGLERARLWRGVCNSVNPYYCDTDSITAESFGDSFVFSKELGDWSIENEYDRVIVAGKKLYAMHKAGTALENPANWKMASKGARLTYRDLIAIADGQTVTFHNPAPTFSASKKEPTFVKRKIRATAADASKIPRNIDPKFVENE